MKIINSIFKLITAVVSANIIVFSAQANCPAISEIIKAFNKNGLPPRGWMLVSYAGNQVDKNFQFEKATWNGISTEMDKIDGNLICEYSNRTKTNPGFLIIQTAAALPAPQGKDWQHIANANRTAVCNGSDPVTQCQF